MKTVACEIRFNEDLDFPVMANKPSWSAGVTLGGPIMVMVKPSWSTTDPALLYVDPGQGVPLPDLDPSNDSSRNTVESTLCFSHETCRFD